ncbi:MAG TPA: hypothetical protein IGR64_16275, partial [Leptolyngbyaceae cyanobacterium M65_K2018_010]|nr:hypothetical protein [Leptolyngbyaceae cyanobacterium M65_K2018_010]
MTLDPGASSPVLAPAAPVPGPSHDAEPHPEDPAQAVGQLLQAHRHERQIILLQDFPDTNRAGCAAY